ncbi:Ubiquitin carboxyl-terminal hydrolase 2 [Hordeum vulgare]|nr:Ubiquitin carboxyl-terminal hydrolase 2 [Hordeum vulgare]
MDDKGKKAIGAAAPLMRHMSVLNKPGPSLSGKPSWTKPLVGWLKVNTDAAFVASSRESSAGYIIRDYMGSLVRAESIKLLACASFEEAEACACAIGPKAALTLGYGKIIIKSDCAAVISNILSPVTPLVAWREHYIVTRELLHTRADIVFRKIGREGKKCAHELAKLSRISGRGAIYLGQLPPHLELLLLSDCNDDDVALI